MAALEAKNSDRENNLFFPWAWGCHSHPHSPSEMVVAALRAWWIVGSERALAALSGWKQGDIRAGRVGGGDSEVWCLLENFADVHYRAAVTILLLNSQYSICKEDGLCPRPLLLHCCVFWSSCIALCSIALDSLLRFPSRICNNAWDGDSSFLVNF